MCPAIPFLLEEFLLEDQLSSLWESPCVLFVVFPLSAFNICSLCLIFVHLINMCLWVFCLGFILFWTLWASWTWVAISFPILGKFSTIISSSIFSWPFFLSSSSGIPMIQMLGEAFHIVPEVLEVVLISFNSFFLFSSLLHLFPPFYPLPHLSYLLTLLFYCWFPPECFFYLIYCIIHY